MYIENANNLICLLNEKTEKKKLIPLVEAIGKDLENILQENLDITVPSLRLFDKTDQERLEDTQKVLDSLNKNPYLGIIEGIGFCKNNLYKFLDYYNIGYCSEFTLSGSHFDVCIGCSIHPSSISSKKVSERMKFDRQVEILEKYGFKTERKENTVHIIFNDHNLNRMNELLKTIEARFIRYETYPMSQSSNQPVFHNIKFIVRPDSLINIDVPVIDFKLKDTETLNADDIVTIYKNLSEIKHELNYYSSMPSMMPTISNLIMYHYKDICDIVGVKDKIWEIVEAHHALARKTNMEIRQKSKEIGSMMTGEIIRQVGNQLQDKINSTVFPLTALKCVEAKATEYSVSAKFVFSATNYYNDEYVSLPSDFCKSLYDCEYLDYGYLELRVFAKEENINKIQELIESCFAGASVDDIDIRKTANGIQINSIEVSFNSLFDFFN